MTEDVNFSFYFILIAKPRSDLATRKVLSTFKTQLCESTLPVVNFMKSKSRSIISDENLASKLKCAVSVKYILDFKDLYKKEKDHASVSGLSSKQTGC